MKKYKIEADCIWGYSAVLALLSLIVLSWGRDRFLGTESPWWFSVIQIGLSFLIVLCIWVAVVIDTRRDYPDDEQKHEHPEKRQK